MVNILFCFFIIIGVLYEIITGNIENVNEEIITCGKKSLEIFANIFPVLVLWLGIMNIAKESGLLNKISNLLYPILKHIFKDIPKDHEALSYISSNIAANMLGIGSAATPFGLKAMQSLQKLNNNKQIASKSMITFIVLNTSGFTLIPTTIISIRNMYNSINPSIVVITIILATLTSTFFAIIIDKLFYKVMK